jgi:hypothetical protein
MSRRVTLPGADELFRSTTPGQPGQHADQAAEPAPARPAPYDPAPARPDTGGSGGGPGGAGDGGAPGSAHGDLAPAPFVPRVAEAPADASEPGLGDPPPRRRPRPVGERRPTGRERHEEKITVYCSAEELIDIERARLTLRGDFGLAADRGRIVREALAVVIADLEAKGEQSVLVRRLRGR